MRVVTVQIPILRVDACCDHRAAEVSAPAWAWVESFRAVKGAGAGGDRPPARDGGAPCVPCPDTVRLLQQTGAATGTDVERGLAGRVLSLIIVGIVIMISVSGARLPEAVTGVLYICQHSSFYDL